MFIYFTNISQQDSIRSITKTYLEILFSWLNIYYNIMSLFSSLFGLSSSSKQSQSQNQNQNSKSQNSKNQQQQNQNGGTRRRRKRHGKKKGKQTKSRKY
jgi:hypothetical protein